MRGKSVVIAQIYKPLFVTFLTLKLNFELAVLWHSLGRSDWQAQTRCIS